MEKKAAKVIEGEALDLVVGNIPLKDEEKNARFRGRSEDPEGEL